MAYRMTAARKRALRKAQLVSARMRRRMGSMKMKSGHKRALAIVVAGSAVVGGAYATNKLMDSTKLAMSNARRDKARQNAITRRNNRGNSGKNQSNSINEILARAKKKEGSGTPSSREAEPGNFARIIRIPNSSSQTVKDLLLEQKGNLVKPRYQGSKSIAGTLKRKYRVQYGDYEMTGVDDDNNPIWEWKATSKVL